MAVRTNNDLQELRKRAFEPIAVVGMACRFPGGANTPDALWQLLHAGVDAIEEVPADRWNIDDYYAADPDARGKVNTRSGGFIKDIDQFDPQFFGISPKEAATMDPQQRLLMEVTWEALENAGQAPDELAGSRTAVFIGMCSNDYAQMMMSAGAENLSGYMASGSAHSIAAGRLSYFLGLQGPCMTVDTACSSSLAAIHLAFQSLRRRESAMAIAGGVNLILSPQISIVLSKMRMLSPDGRCKTFDAAADGFSRSEGCGVVVLKRYSDALQAGDRILALVRGCATNQDGRSSGLTVPNGSAQQALVREALLNSDVESRQVSYIETHGTGTSLGDPVEVRALGAVFGADHDAANPLMLGSIKANLGHLEGAAGIASFIKTVLALREQTIPGNIHFKNPNPHIPWTELPVQVPTQPTSWVPRGGRRIAGISSFGFSGTNVHVVVEEAPAAQETPLTGTPIERTAHLLTLSAKSEKALHDAARQLSRHLGADRDSLADACFTAAAARSHFPHRLAVVTDSSADAAEKLRRAASGESPSGVHRGLFSPLSRLKVAFLFSGQGSQYANMGRVLYETQPVFRSTLQKCDELLKDGLGESILSVIYPENANSTRLDHTQFTQPALFAIEYSLAQMWMSWGIQPAAVLGHSLGEYVAACIAGMFSLEDGLRLVAERGRIMQSIKQPGEMIAVFASEAVVMQAIAAYSGTVGIAALNGPENIVVSGAAEDVKTIAAGLVEAGVRVQKLQVLTAFHSPLVNPVLDAFEEAARNIRFQPPRIPLVANVTGRLLKSDEVLNASYWRLHMRSPVRFAESVQVLAAKGCTAFMEIGPGATLLSMAGRCLPEGAGMWLPSLRAGRDDWHQTLDTLAALYTRGAPVDWKAFDRGYPRKKVELPNYPFERETYWFEERSQRPVWQEWLYDVQWERLNAGLPVGSSADAGSFRWLILADRGGVGERLAQMLAGKGHHAELLYASSGKAAVTEAVRLLAQKGGHRVVHLWSLDVKEPDNMTAGHLDNAYTLTCESMLHVIQALAGHTGTGDPARLWTITAGAEPVTPEDRISPAQSLAWGFGRTIAVEHPEYWGGLIDLPPGESLDVKASLLFSAVCQSGDEDQIAYRDGERFAPRLVPTAAEKANTAPFSIRTDGTYLITGGLGHLGVKLGRWLAEQGAKNLVLIGRTGLRGASPQTLAAVEAMKSLGAEVQALAVDSGDEHQMEMLSERLRQGPPLAGVIAAAGAYSSVLLRDAVFEDLAPTLRSKVAATWLLHKLADAFEPDFFVLFSSITSLLGTRELAHYAAGCHFQDTLAAYRRSIGKPAIAINWGMWDESGADARHEQSFRQSGMQPMASTAALSALRHLLISRPVQKTVASIRWPVLKPLYESRRRRPFLEKIFLPETNAVTDRISGDPSSDEGARGALRGLLESGPVDEHPALIETAVLKAVARILGMEEQSIVSTRSLSEMGMDSLMASELRNFLQRETGLPMPQTLAYEHPTVLALSQYLLTRLNDAGRSESDDASAARIQPAPRNEGERTAFPLSLAQEHFWRLYKDNVAFNVPLPYRITGMLRLDAIEYAIDQIVRRHESLRTTFHTDEHGEPVQVVTPRGAVIPVVEDLSEVPADERESCLQQRVAGCSETLFDVERGPLLKVWLFELGSADHVLLFVVHHMVFDGWSMKILMQELETLYNARVQDEPPPLAPLSIQYPDFADWQRKRLKDRFLDEQRAYWRQQLGPALPELPFAARTGRETPVLKGSKHRMVLPAVLIESLKRVGTDASHTLFTTMLAAFGTLIHHHSGKKRVLILSAAAGRATSETEALIGMFAEPLVLSADFSSDPRFSELLEQIRASFLGALSHPLPIEHLIESSGANDGKTLRPFSQIFFDSLPDIPMNLKLAGTEQAVFFPTERDRMRHDLELYIRPVPAGMYCALWCNENLFDSSMPSRMAGEFRTVLERIVEDPAQPLSALLRGISKAESVPGGLPGGTRS